ncbi:hypothetical protein MTO96_017526 [Rhipicephalus appendiculatus]
MWHVGLQLRELRVPGKTVPRYGSSTGAVVAACSECEAATPGILFHVLLVQHSCVESLHLDNVLIEGSGLGEYRECVVSGA